jgi:two-component system sensor histidine kinase TctE
VGWLFIPLAGLCVLATIVAYRLAAKSANDSFDVFLMNSADSIAARIKRNSDGVIIADLPPAAQEILRHNGIDKFFYQIIDSKGHRLGGDSALPLPRDTITKSAKFRYAETQGEMVRICRIPVDLSPTSNTIWVQAAETLRSRNALLEQIFFSILVPQLALLVLASISVWFGIQRGLVPLDKLSKILRSRNRLDLSPVDLGGYRSIELMPVTDALNELLSDADKHIGQQRQFIANAAHELRTPVTALKTSVEYLERNNKDTRLTAGLKQISEATNRTVHLISRLLTLARTTGAIHKSRDLVDLASIVDRAGAGFVPEARRRNVEMHFDLPEAEVKVLGNQGDLEELVTNLLENAIQYTAVGGGVWVQVSEIEPISLVIEDNGPGIPDQEKQKVFDRFFRGSRTKHEAGCGLGLSIVSEIAAANNMSVALADRIGGGTSVRVTFASSSPSSNKNDLISSPQSIPAAN